MKEEKYVRVDKKAQDPAVGVGFIRRKEEERRIWNVAEEATVMLADKDTRGKAGLGYMRGQVSKAFH